MRNRNEAPIIPVIPVDELLHTDCNPFCIDLSCPCKEDQELIQGVDEQYQDGLLTADEATRGVKGWWL